MCIYVGCTSSQNVVCKIYAYTLYTHIYTHMYVYNMCIYVWYIPQTYAKIDKYKRKRVKSLIMLENYNAAFRNS